MEIVIYISLIITLALFCWHVRAKDKGILDDLDRLEKQIDAFVSLQSRRAELFSSLEEEINNEF